MSHQAGEPCELPSIEAFPVHTVFTCGSCSKKWERTARGSWSSFGVEQLEAREDLTPPADLPDHLDWLPSYLEEVLATMSQRGKKYGPGNIQEFGELGVLVRLSDKLARLRHTTEHFEDETSADSWIDVIGYGLIGLAWSRGTWPGSEKS